MNKRFLFFLAAFIALYFVLKYIAGFYIDYEWFRQNNGLSVFWVLFMTKFNVQAIFGIIFIAIFLLNFLLIRVLGGKGRFFSENFLDRIKIPAIGSSRRLLLILLTGTVVITGFIMGGGASAYWKEYLMFSNAVPFQGFPADPVFNRDMGFYVFSLPFYQFLYGWFMMTLVIITIFTFVLHFFNGAIYRDNEGGWELSLFCRAHLSILLALIVILYGFSYQLSAYELLFSQIGKFYGAGYTALHASLLSYRVAEVISFIAGALLLFNVFKRSFRFPVIVLLTLIPVYFILGVIYPALQQKFIVIPNELDREKPYIQNNINFTRLAYGIDRVEEIPFPNKRELSFADITKNKETLESVRLWDWRPLKQTYKQLQELKQYYFFNDVDVDRYYFNGKKIAVNLAARELTLDNLGANSQTWQNRHLIYTHGYGMVMSRVDRITPEGLPVLIIKDIPPVTDTGIKIDRPEIYYGEHKNSYVITNTSINPGEFDYPSGEENKYTTYGGTGGMKLDSFFKRLMAAIAFGDINLLISGNISGESRLLFRRNIVEIAQNFAPFLELDNDPYLVVSEGKLYWMIDGYTTSDQFPYSTPVDTDNGRINYIRNSVKITIDAYNGNINCYLADTKDPIIQVYNKIFPGILKTINEMPPDLQKHIRYPEDIFNIQCTMLLRYHMTNSNVFYNNEDVWQIPMQIFGDKEEPIHSYYLVTRLPGEKESGFLLIMPFSPYKKPNMLAFLTAKCDPSEYGRLQLYQLPKNRLSDGPMQIESRINTDPDISKQLALWNQKGSSVIRGNMLVIPIEESLLYIEPLYLKAEAIDMPELKRVIVSFSDRIVMESDLSTSLQKLFYGTGTSDKNSTQSGTLKELADRAYYHYMKAEQYMREGNWKGYGEEIENLRTVLTMMKNQGN